MKFIQLSLAAKLWAALAFIIVLLATGMTCINLRSDVLLNQTQQALSAQSEQVVLATRWVGLVQANTARDLAIVISGDGKMNGYFTPSIMATITQISEVQKKLVAQATSPQEQAVLDKIMAVRKRVLASRGKAVALKKAGDEAAALVEAGTEFEPAVKQYLSNLQEFADLQTAIFGTLQHDIEIERAHNALLGRLILLVLVAMFAAGAIYLIRAIRAPLQAAISVAEHIAKGNLTRPIATGRSDEFGEMMRALLHMQNQLRHLVADVREGTNNMAVASQEIAVGNQDLSNRTEQAAASLEETAASLEHLTTTVQDSTDAARRANALADSASNVAQRGGMVVGQMIATMQDINASSQKIADIIGVIDGIAFQTNILALNAAVEAARAGEQGRGFAVVASEVRSLASRSAQAAKEIKALINTSVNKVEDGTRQVSDAGATMQDIVSSVQRVSDIIGEISTAAIEQTSELVQVNAAVTQLDALTQQNAALVEQSAAAAASMEDQAQRLTQVVSSFTLN